MKDNDERYNKREAEERLKRTLSGAFAGAPTQLKAIPKKRVSPAPTKAEVAAQKRADKTVIKRMRKR